MRSVKHPRAAIIFCLTLHCQQLTSSRDHLKSRLTMPPDLTPVTRICMSLDQLNSFFIFYFSHRWWFARSEICHLLNSCIIFNNWCKISFFNHRVFPVSVLRSVSVLLFCYTYVCQNYWLMRKIGFIFLFKWICHFLSEGKMMIQED